MTIKDVEDLKVYRDSLALLSPLYRLIALLPKFQEQRLRKQIVSSAQSIPALIAEGFAKKKSPKEFCRFLTMALGSSDEVITHIRVVKTISFPNIKTETCDSFIEKYREVSKQLNGLIKAWKKFS